MSLLLALQYAFPLSLPWTGYWRSSWSLPWPGETTAGLSLGRDLYEATNFPGSGTAQNGYTPPAFDGANDLLTADGVAEDYFGATAWTIHAVVRCNSLAAPGGFTADNEALLSVGPGSAAVNLAFDSTGVTALQYDGFGGTSETARIAVGTSSYRIIQARWTGTQIQCRVDGGAWQSAACTSQVAYSGTGEILRVGVNYDGTKFLDCDVLEIGTFDQSLSDSDLDALKSYAQIRYALGGAVTQTLASFGLFLRQRYGLSGASLGALLASGFGFRLGDRRGASALTPAAVTTASFGLRSGDRYGVSTSTPGALTTASSGYRTSDRAGTSTATPGALALASFGTRGDRRGVSAVAATLSTSGFGLRGADRCGTSALAATLTTPSLSLRSADRVGTSGLAPAAVTLSSSGLRLATRTGLSALTNAVSLASLGLRGDRAGSSGVSLGAVSLASLGLRQTDRTGTSALSTITPIVAAGFGLRDRDRFGTSTATAGSPTIVSLGLRTGDRRGSSGVAPLVQASTFGLVLRAPGGTSGLSSSVTTASSGLRLADRGGLSSFAPAGVFVTSFGSSLGFRYGASDISLLTGVQTVAGSGLRLRDRFGSSAVTVGALSLATFGQPVRLVGGISPLVPGTVGVAGLGFRGPTQSGVSFTTPVVNLTGFGSRSRDSLGRSASASSVTVSSAGRPILVRGGQSTLAPSAVLMASLGLRSQFVAGASGPLPIQSIAGFGLRGIPRMGSAFITADPPLFFPPAILGPLTSHLTARTSTASRPLASIETHAVATTSNRTTSRR